ncbi:condensation domain-containing protein, partial [Paenactinomyces guangxiensis]|uniref:condensation domain-containing protein n=2 Tax=Paenactinomyces guangxiensis TaxID=1490290 RepID=UPI003612C96D
MVDRRNLKNIYGLSPLQRGMLFHSLKDERSHAYFEQITLSIEGQLNISCLEESLNGLIQKYDLLRTIFLYENLNEPLQVVLKERKARIFYKDLSYMTDKEKQICIEEFKQKDRERRFDLSRDLLIRFSLLQSGSQSYQLICSFHHILFDGWCIGILFNDLFRMYQRRVNGQPVLLERVAPYSDYIEWLEEQDQERARAYWKNYLQDYERPAVVPRQARKGNEKNIQEEVICRLDAGLTNQLSRLAGMHQVTLNTVFQTIWGVLLQKYNNTRDVVFGAVVSGRPSEIQDVEKIVGLFINTIPVRVRSREKETFGELIKRVQRSALQSEEYDYLSLADIQVNTALSGDLIDHIIAFESYPVDRDALDNSMKALDFQIIDVDVFEQTNYDFTVLVNPGKELTVKFSFNPFIYSREFVENICKHFKKVAELVVANPHIQLEDIEIVSEEEKRQLLLEFNDTKADYPREKTIHQLFEEQVQKTPDHMAVVSGAEQLTYRELNERANQLARVLREKGVRRDQIIGLWVENSPWMMVGMLAIL